MIKNYTSSVPAAVSISQIEQKLVAFGATDISKRYNAAKQVEMFLFRIPAAGGMVPICLPARVDQVFQRLKNDYIRSVSKPKDSTIENLRAQSERTAWKIMKDWVDIQLSLIELDQAELVEIFLPFVWSAEKDQTFFESVKAGGFKMLGAGNNKRGD